MERRDLLGALVCCSFAALMAGSAQGQAQATAARFAPPVRLRAGEAYLGEGRLFPSPALYDVDRNGVTDVVIGDLVGRPTYALRSRTEEGQRLAAEQKLLGADGKPIDFDNW